MVVDAVKYILTTSKHLVNNQRSTRLNTFVFKVRTFLPLSEFQRDDRLLHTVTYC